MSGQGDEMSRSARASGYLTWPRGAGAILLAGCLAATPASGQSTGTAVSTGMAGQKARMLEGFFSSYRLREALGSNPDAVGPLAAEARAKLAAGKAALADGRIAEAMELFDAGMRAVAHAIALTSPGSNWDARAASDAFVAQRHQVESYLAVLERADDLSTAESADVVSLRTRLDEADRLFTGSDLKPAREALEQVYRDIVGLVSEIRRGHTVVVSRVFETPQGEFEYERRRNHSYDLLVQIALAERGGGQPGLAALAARLIADSEALRDQAEREGASGDFATAIGTLERATERLLVVLRASGVVTME